MGYLVKDKCYADAATAADAYFGSAAPAMVPGTTTYVSQYTKDAAGWKLVRWTQGSSGVITTTVTGVPLVPTFPTCDEMQPLNDGMALGWLLVGVMVVAWGAVMVRRQIA